MARRGHAEFAAQGIRVGGKRVARLMRAAQLQGVSRRHFVTTRRDPTAEPAADLAQRDFHAAGPNLLWLADIVYIATGGGFVYLAWCSMPGAAASSAGPSPPTCAPSWSWVPWIERSPAVRWASIHHSDHGTQHTSIAFGLRCREAGIQPSMAFAEEKHLEALVAEIPPAMRRWQRADRHSVCARPPATPRLAPLAPPHPYGVPTFSGRPR